MEPRLIHRVITAVILFMVAHSLRASSTHPLIAPYPGANTYSKKILDYTLFPFPSTLPNTSGTKVPTRMVTGDLSQMYYTVDGVSTLKIFRNYQQALKELGFSTLAQCELAECGSEQAARDFGASLSPTGAVYNYYHDPYALIAEGQGNKGKIHVAIFVGGYESETAIQQVIVEEEPLENNLIAVDVTYLQNQPAATQVTSTPTASDLERDHPLISRYPGARIYNERSIDYTAYNLPTSISNPSQANFAIQSTSLTGDLSQHTYTIDNVSTLKVAENYQTALTDAGFHITFRCTPDNCGNEDQARKLGAMLASTESVYNDYRKPYFIVAQKNADKGPVYVSLFIGGHDEQVGVQQVILETEALDTGLVKVTAESLKRSLDETGKASIYGIHFDTGKATIKNESADTLTEIEALLKKNPDLKLYVVGHTDDTGNLADNQSLSSLRADAVVKALVDKGVNKSRLLAFGAGPYAPSAANTTSDGKARNRRVELVKRLQ